MQVSSKKTFFRDNPGQNIWDKLQLLCEIAHYGESSISIFNKFCASIEKIFILEGRLGTRI